MKQPSPVVFLDRDGTINVDYGYVHKTERFHFLPNAVAGLKAMQSLGYKLVIVSNQSGIGRGYYTKEDYHAVTALMKQRLQAHHIHLHGTHFCAHAPEERCGCRKPAIGMFREACQSFSLHPEDCFMIGDKPSDIEAGNAFGCTTILVLTGKSRSPEGMHPDYVAKDLLDAARFIAQHSGARFSTTPRRTPAAVSGPR